MDDKEKGLYTFSRAAMAGGMKISAILMATRIVPTLSQLVQSTTPAATRPTRKLVQLT